MGRCLSPIVVNVLYHKFRFHNRSEIFILMIKIMPTMVDQHYLSAIAAGVGKLAYEYQWIRA